MSFLFLSLLEEMLRKLRQRLRRKVRTDRIILHRSAEFVSNLFVDRVDNFFAREHGETFR